MRISAAAIGWGLTLAGPAPAEGGGVLNGFMIGHVPRHAGPSVSNFEYEPDDGITFTARVWERETTDGGHAVDLQVIILRGDRLATLGKLRDFMAEYHERDPVSWTGAQVGTRPAFKDGSQVFWLVQTGVAASVTLDADRFGAGELLKVAEGVQQQ
jgi:hypothetical protein